jgi:pimeloyl-ACP methyl ester carboxylesterase
MDVFQRAAPHPQAPKLAPDRHGAIWLPDEAFAAAFAQQAPTESTAMLAAVQRPVHLPCIGTPVGRPLWKDRPSWFLVAKEDRMIAAETQRFMATRMGATQWSAAVDHTPMVSAPEIVVEVILEAVHAAA